jgi:hypothetical protein
MEPRVILYQHKDEGISVTIEAYFSDGALVVEGYDIGKRVEEYWGDSDYEYSTTISSTAIPLLCKSLGVSNDPVLILNTLSSKFGGNTCYSTLLKFLEQNGVPSQSQSWA